MSTVTWADGTSRTWSGTSKCLCYGCRNLFSSPSAFDKHRKGGKCLDPAKIKLELKDGVWRYPGPAGDAATALRESRFAPSKDDRG